MGRSLPEASLQTQISKSHGICSHMVDQQASPPHILCTLPSPKSFSLTLFIISMNGNSPFPAALASNLEFILCSSLSLTSQINISKFYLLCLQNILRLQGEHPVITEAGAGVMHPPNQTRDCQQPPEAGKIKEGSSPGACGESEPCSDTLRLLASRTRREYTAIVISHSYIKAALGKQCTCI